jgi:hypothetical protein
LPRTAQPKWQENAAIIEGGDYGTTCARGCMPSKPSLPPPMPPMLSESTDFVPSMAHHIDGRGS